MKPSLPISESATARTTGSSEVGRIAVYAKTLVASEEASDAVVSAEQTLTAAKGALSDAATSCDRALGELTVARRKLPNNSEALYIAARIDRRQNRWESAVANLQKANDLDPRNSGFAYFLGQTYFELRRYSEWEQLIKKCAASGTFEGPWVESNLAEIKLAQGDPAAAQSLLEQVPLDFSPSENIWDVRFKTALYLRDYDAANRVIAAMPAKFADRFPFRWITSADGLVAVARGDKQKAQSIFLEDRKRLDAIWGTKVKDSLYFDLAAQLDAGLGRKEEAIREARRAVDLKPIAQDSLQGSGPVYTLALVYAWSGEGDRALEHLELVATIPAGPSYADLRLNPCWDPLRGDKRFDKIIAAAKAASK